MLHITVKASLSLTGYKKNYNTVYMLTNTGIFKASHHSMTTITNTLF